MSSSATRKPLSSKPGALPFPFPQLRPGQQTCPALLTGTPAMPSRVHFIQPLKERLVREVGYGLSLEGASAADLVKSREGKA